MPSWRAPSARHHQEMARHGVESAPSAPRQSGGTTSSSTVRSPRVIRLRPQHRRVHRISVDSASPCRKPFAKPLDIVDTARLVNRVRLRRMHQVHQLVRQRDTIGAEVPEVPAEKHVPAADVLGRFRGAVNQVPDLHQLPRTIPAIEVVRHRRRVGPTRAKSRISPVIAQTHALIDAHRIDDFTGPATAKSDYPVADARGPADLRLADGQGTPAVEGSWRGSAVVTHHVAVDARARRIAC